MNSLRPALAPASISALIMGLALVLSACGQEAEPPADAPEATASAPYSPSEALLEGDGFALANPGGGGTPRKVSFGESEAEVVGFLTRFRGSEPQRSTNPECPAGPLSFAEWDDHLILVFQEGNLVGWNLAIDGQPGYATANGIHIGLTRDGLAAAAPGVAVQDSTLGHVFSVDGVTGVLRDGGPAATVDALWAGTVCIFS